jgi:hypothetical protein
MNKTIKALIIVSGLLAVMLTLGIGLPTLLANDSAPKSTPPSAITKDDGVIAQAAAILNISTENLTQAMKQAQLALKDTKPTDDAYYAKVAEILGIDKATLVAAIQKAANAVFDKKVAAILDQAVAKGTITQDEETQIETWFSQRPSALDKIFNIDKMHSFLGWGHSMNGKTNTEKPQQQLQQNNRGKMPQKPNKTTPQPTTTANTTSLRMF